MREYYLRELEKAQFGKTLLEQVLLLKDMPVPAVAKIKEMIASAEDSIKFFGNKLDNYEG